jgi:mRNA interferase RelE/StbE
MYHVKYTEYALETLRKIDRQIATFLLAWTIKHLEGTKNPFPKGETLSKKHQGILRYRIGDYRLLTRIEDRNVVVYSIDVGPRKQKFK